MERDFPKGHPAASDYAGEPYDPPRAPYGEDFPEGHPARGGSNITAIDTVDGVRAAMLHASTDLIELASVGCLPPLLDRQTQQPVGVTAEELAHIYAMRKGLISDDQMLVAEEYAMDAVAEHGYEKDEARALLQSYCVTASEQ